MAAWGVWRIFDAKPEQACWPDVIRRVRAVLLVPGLVLAAVGVAWADNPLRLEHARGRLDFSGRLQTGYAHRFEAAGHEDDQDHDRFILGQVRFRLEGEVDPDLSYELTLDYLAADGYPEAKDLWLGWSPSSWLWLRVGQQKPEVSRSRYCSDGMLLFDLRSLVVDELVPPRDRGAQLWLRPFGDQLRLALGVFTGRGVEQMLDDERGLPRWTGRLAWQPLARMRNSEGDLERTATPALEAALFGSFSQDGAPDDEGSLLRRIDGDKLIWGGDLTLKWQGLFASVELIGARFTPAAGNDHFAVGYLAQASYYIAPLRLQAGLRYDWLNPSTEVHQDERDVLTYGLIWYPRQRRDFLLRLEYLQRWPCGAPTGAEDHHDLLLQLQLEFG